jgi:hypothetical protein
LGGRNELLARDFWGNEFATKIFKKGMDFSKQKLSPIHVSGYK